jgi:5-methyltetrahydropteroyltriglutamate--homocysteine methyltransferase
VILATSVSHYPKVGDQPGQQRLRQTIARADRGQAGPADVDRAAADMTVAAIEEQEQSGLDLVTDGQIRWQDPITYLAGRLQGLRIEGLLRWFESNTYYRQPHAAGEVSWTGPILVDDLRFAREHARQPVKAVVTGPYTIAALSEAGAGGRRTLTLELARALNQELKALAEERPPWIQIDEPAIAHNPGVRYVRDFDLFNEAMRVLTDGVGGRLSLYVYHGDVADVPGLLDLPFQMFGLDFVQGAANWDLLRRWPPGRGLGLGIVDARNVHMEKESDLAEAIARAVTEVGDRVVHLSPSCGLEFLPRESARRKLELVARVAHQREVRA